MVDQMKIKPKYLQWYDLPVALAYHLYPVSAVPAVLLTSQLSVLCQQHLALEIPAQDIFVDQLARRLIQFLHCGS